MITNLKQLKCGECGESKHLLFIEPSSNGEIIVECINCKSQSKITVTHPKIEIRYNAGNGTLCKFD
jgi:hypothetical protein